MCPNVVQKIVKNKKSRSPVVGTAFQRIYVVFVEC